MTCRFSFEDKQYEVPLAVYDQDGDIRLPDERIVRPISWLESCPPKIGELMVVESTDRPVFEATSV